MAKTNRTPDIPGAPAGSTWQSLVSDITGGGTSQKKIAADAGDSTSAVSALQKGDTKDPGYRLGHHVVTLHGKMREAGLIP